MPYDATKHRDSRGRFASPQHRQEVVDKVKVDYEGDDLFLADIAKHYEISPATIDYWARKYGWQRRQPHIVRADDLVGRLLGLLSGQIAELEAVMKNGGTEVAMLAKLVTTLDRVLALKGRATADKPRSSKRVEELRAKIAERIGELNKA